MGPRVGRLLPCTRASDRLEGSGKQNTTIISEIVDIKRFATAEKLVSYAVLAPSHRDSGQTQKGGGITKHGSAWLRNAMVEAANTTIRFDPRMKSFYLRIAKRRGKQKAKVAAARQILEIIWHMLTWRIVHRITS
ncbi:MAG: transposase [Nitrososphaera sp.]